MFKTDLKHFPRFHLGDLHFATNVSHTNMAANIMLQCAKHAGLSLFNLKLLSCLKVNIHTNHFKHIV